MMILNSMEQNRRSHILLV